VRGSSRSFGGGRIGGGFRLRIGLGFFLGQPRVHFGCFGIG
jgi:hypothetical protein